MLFYTVAAQICSPTNPAEGFPFLLILDNMLCVDFLIIAILVGVRWSLTVFYFAFIREHSKVAE